MHESEKVKVKVKSCPTLSNPMDCSPPGSSIHGIFQARILERGAIAFSTASVRSLPFLSFIEPIFAWHVPLVSLIFLTRSLIFPILLFSSISLQWSLRKAFLSLLAILWNSAFKCLGRGRINWVLDQESFIYVMFSYLSIFLNLFPCSWRRCSEDT